MTLHVGVRPKNMSPPSLLSEMGFAGLHAKAMGSRSHVAGAVAPPWTVRKGGKVE